MKRTTSVLTSLGALVGVLAAAAALADCGGSKAGGPSGGGGATQDTGGVAGLGGSGGATQGTGGVTVTGHGGSTGAAGGSGMGGTATGGAGSGSGGATGIATGGVTTGAGASPAGTGGAGVGGGQGGNVGTGGNLGGTGGSAGRPAGGGAGTAGATGTGLTGGAGGTGGIYPCPAVLPSNGDNCSYSGRGYVVVCQYDECPPGTLTGPRYVASCPTSPTMSELWTVRELDCPPAIECGECPPGLDCAASCMSGDTCGTNQCLVEQICLRMVYPDGHWHWDCAPNNCGAQPLDCSCVGAVCGQGAQSGDWQCTAADAPIITCECIDGC